MALLGRKGLLKPKQHYFLPLGVRQTSVDEQRTVTICMDEIKRCQDTSLGMAFIAILGDKYGCRPLPPSVNAVEFENLLRHIDDTKSNKDQSDRELVMSWYLRDDNSIPPCYVLQPISTKFAGINSSDEETQQNADKKWRSEQKAIWSHLRLAAERAGLKEEDKLKYMVSMTQLEVESGLVTYPERNHRSIFVDRRFDDIKEEDKVAGEFVNLTVGKYG